jgi:hypothetical protein
MTDYRFQVAALGLLSSLLAVPLAGAQQLQPSYSGSNYADTLLTHFTKTTLAYALVPGDANYLVTAKASMANDDGDAQFGDCELIAASTDYPAIAPAVLDQTHVRIQSAGNGHRQAIVLAGSLCNQISERSVVIELRCSTYDGTATEAVVTATRVPHMAVTGSSQPAPSAAFGSCIHQDLPMLSTGIVPQSRGGGSDPYHSTVSVTGRGFQPGETLQIVFRGLPDVVPDVCRVCSALYSHLLDVPAPTPAQVGADGTFQVAEVVPHNIEGGAALGPVTIIVESSDGTPGVPRAIGAADPSAWIGPMPFDP